VQLSIIGVPADLGASRRGTDMGPSAMRCARLMETLVDLGHEVVDLGNLHVPVPESRAVQDPRARYLPEIMALCAELADAVEAAVRGGRLPVVLGGDHSVALGSLAGLARVRGDTGLLWVDAHADFNTPQTTPSGNVHGMMLAASTGSGGPALTGWPGIGAGPQVRQDAAVLIGVREVDLAERRALTASRVRTFTMKEIDRQGIGRVMEEAVRIAGAGGSRPIHLSLDLDVLDPMYAPGVGTPVAGGLTYREAHLAMELLADSGLLGSLEIVEVNPVLDEGNRTAQLAVGLCASALGKRIL
jgi:arginase